MTEYNIRHVTSYEYEVPVLHAHHLGHLRPRELTYQRVAHSEISCTPASQATQHYVDYFGNGTDMIEVLDRHDKLDIVATSRVTVTPRALSTQAVLSTMSWSEARDWYASSAPLEAQEYTFDSPLVRRGALFRDYAAPCFAPGRPLVEAVIELNTKIFTEFVYQPLSTDVSTPVASVMKEKKGVCQDFAHVAVACLRSYGLPARYVSGYLETVPPPGVKKLKGADASHAWASVFVPDHGWLEFDPTNGLLPTDRHITLAWGRDFSDVTPLKGVVLGGGSHRVAVGVDVEPVTPVGVATPPAAAAS